MAKLKGMFKYAFLLMNVVSFKGYGQHNLIEKQTEVSVTDSFSLVKFIERENNEHPAHDIYKIWENKYINYNVEAPNEHRIGLTDFHMPCKNNKVTSSYGYRNTFKRNHYGTDIKVFIGDTIYSAFSGKVRVVEYSKNGYGKYIIIRHDNGLETLYAHLSKQIVKNNQLVRSGEAIGLGGNTGRSTGPHLHFEVRFLGKYINPETLFSFDTRKSKYEHFTLNKNGNIVSYVASSENAPLNATDEQTGDIIHKVKKGESLYTISKKYDITVNELKRINGLTKNTLHIGQILKCS